MNKQFSIITSVYKNDKPEFVRVALDSMLVNQSVKPTEIVLIRDGPVPDGLGELLSEYESKYPDVMNIIRLEKNGGLGNALQLGTETAKYDLVARMDSDDICLPNRFEKQLAYMRQHPDVDIVGGQITEFIGDSANIVGQRVVPTDNETIYEYMKSRCALNHVTVMFRKEAVLRVGNYQDWFWNEDYYLWVRMMAGGCKFGNVEDVLVNVRSGTDQYARRGGRKYYESEKGIQKLLLENGMITRTKYMKNVAVRWLLQIAMPNWLRGWFFRTFARN
ncbi:MAG: glycosyltransferase [Bacteroides sp.]|nr:glycosyltransferase [Bacteroides sp.]MCM1447841.1 glycosyltransferase [Bacteroides sp.]